MGILDALLDPKFRQDVGGGVLDALNRGGVAGALGAPVDIATMALRPFGYSVDKPVGGSEWLGQKMQDAGMVSPDRNAIAELLASVATPMGMGKAAPAVFNAEQAMARNASIAGPSSGKLGAQRGIFGGVNAKSADFDALSKAQRRLAAGDDSAQVWAEHGWGRGPDGKWRYEIDDSAAKWKFEKGQKPITEIRKLDNHPDRVMPLEQRQVLEHPDLFAAYPEAQGIEITSAPAEVFGAGSFRSLPNKWGRVSVDGPLDNAGEIPLGGARDNYLNTNIHELQHALQYREDFTGGGSPEMMSRAAKSALQRFRELGGFSPKAKTPEWEAANNKAFQLQDAFDPAGAYEMYKRLGGEAEARLTEARMRMSPRERRAQYPWEPEYFEQATGVPVDSLIGRRPVSGGPSEIVLPGEPGALSLVARGAQP